MRYLIITLICLCTTAPASVQSTAAEPAAASPAYRSYARLLRIFVDDRGLVNYPALARERVLIAEAAADIGAVGRRKFSRLEREGRIAHLVNAYNLFALRTVAERWPVERNWLTGWFYPANSIRQISGAFDGNTHELLGQRYTLDRIERELVTGYDEPRVHMAINCASMGCPPLRNAPYTADSLEAQLEHQVRRFLAEPDNFRIERTDAEVQLSELFDWYAGHWLAAGYTALDTLPPAQRGREGLSAEQRAVLEFVAGYVDEERREYIEAGGYELEYIDFDWSLNLHGGTR